MSAGKDPKSVLEEGVDDLSRVVDGLAGLLIGKSKPATDVDDAAPEQPVISEDVDRAIQDLGAAVGNVLLVAGDHLQRTAGDDDPDAAEHADDTPLVHGARSLGRGLAALAGDVLGALQPEGSPSAGDDTPTAEDDPA